MKPGLRILGSALGLLLPCTGAGEPAAPGPALARLRAEVDRALKERPRSVMEKTVLPPGGDRHDYLSLAPYAWPDPGRPDGRPWITRDGIVNPASREGGDRDALGRMAAQVETLALAWRHFGEERYAAKAVTVLRVWFLDPATRMNPHLEYAQGVPGRHDGQAIGLIDGVPLIRVVQAVPHLEGSAAWTPGTKREMQAWFRACLDWMRDSRHGRAEAQAANNHGSWYLAQTAAYALFVGDVPRARAAVEQGRDRIARQIEPDGRQPLELKRTRSYSYSLYNLEALFTLAEMGPAVGVDLFGHRTPDGRSLRAALDYLAPYMREDRRWPGPQVTAVHRPDEALAALLRRGALAFQAPLDEDVTRDARLDACRFQLRWAPRSAGPP